MGIVNLEVRRKVRAENLLVEIQVIAAERGQADLANLAREVCMLLATPEPPPANVVALRQRKVA